MITVFYYVSDVTAHGDIGLVMGRAGSRVAVFPRHRATHAVRGGAWRQVGYLVGFRWVGVEWRSASGSEPPRMATRAGGGVGIIPFAILRSRVHLYIVRVFLAFVREPCLVLVRSYCVSAWLVLGLLMQVSTF